MGWAINNFSKPREGIKDLIDAIINHVPQPKIADKKEFSMLATMSENHKYFGKLLIGKVNSGFIFQGDMAQTLDQSKNIIEVAKISKILKRQGLNQTEEEFVTAGDIICIGGLKKSLVSHTINQSQGNIVIPTFKIEEPMVTIYVSPNSSPLQGKEGSKYAYPHIKERLFLEGVDDCALKVEEDSLKSESIKVTGRGDLHLGILIENMRREGFEISISPPSIIIKNVGGNKLEPIEKITLECQSQYENILIDKILNRKGTLELTEEIKPGLIKLVFSIPTRGMIGLRAEIMMESKGTVKMKSQFDKFDSYRGALKRSSKGSIISTTNGTATSFGLHPIEKKGRLYVGPNTPVYEGMVIGEHIYDYDLEMNPCKTKRLTNVRTHTHDENIHLLEPKQFGVDEALSFIKDDELIEVTPKSIRIRKKILDKDKRKQEKRKNKNAE